MLNRFYPWRAPNHSYMSISSYMSNPLSSKTGVHSAVTWKASAGIGRYYLWPRVNRGWALSTGNWTGVLQKHGSIATNSSEKGKSRREQIVFFLTMGSLCSKSELKG